MIKLKGKSHAWEKYDGYYELNSLHADSSCAKPWPEWLMMLMHAHGFAHDEYAWRLFNS